MTRCSDNSCGDCSWCGYQDEPEIEEVEQDGPEPDDIETYDDDEWVDYLSGKYQP